MLAEQRRRHAAVAVHALRQNRRQLLNLVVHHRRRRAAVQQIKARPAQQREEALEVPVQVGREDLSRLVQDGRDLLIVRDAELAIVVRRDQVLVGVVRNDYDFSRSAGGKFYETKIVMFLEGEEVENLLFLIEQGVGDRFEAHILVY